MIHPITPSCPSSLPVTSEKDISNQFGSSLLDFIFFILFVFLIFSSCVQHIKHYDESILASECYEKKQGVTCAQHIIYLKKTIDSDYEPFHQYLSESYSDGQIDHQEYSKLKRIHRKYIEHKQSINDKEKLEYQKQILDEALRN